MFIENNQSFRCAHCQKIVALHPTSSRNHCTFCLTSLHVDESPGDRKNNCLGIMRPIGLEVKSRKTQIIFKCEKCGEVGKNIVAEDDNKELLIELSGKPVTK